MFGAKVTEEFLMNNDLSLLCRSHQLVDEGFKYMFNEKLATVWSGKNFFYFAEKLEKKFQKKDYRVDF